MKNKTNIISENIEKYNSIMTRYRNGEYGDNHLTIDEILEQEKEKDLIKKMTLSELQYLENNSFGITKLLFAEKIKNRLNISNNKEKGKVKKIR